jgi:hypothetical protein
LNCNPNSTLKNPQYEIIYVLNIPVIIFFTDNSLYKKTKFERFFNDDTQELVVDMNYIVLNDTCSFNGSGSSRQTGNLCNIQNSVISNFVKSGNKFGPKLDSIGYELLKGLLLCLLEESITVYNYFD